jgi:bifunctional non-homologous end joining protein LigD
MLAGAGAVPRTGDWLVEPKWDGVRSIVTVENGNVRLTSRNSNDITAAYPELVAPPAALAGRDVVLDGELVALDAAGRPNFGLLQRRMHVRHPAPALVQEVPVDLAIFDVLWVDGTAVTSRTQAERRRILDDLAIAQPPWITSPLLDLPPGDELLEACRALGMEGFVAKRADARYLEGQRTDAWIKVKCTRRREFVVGGWSEGRGGRTGSLGSLALGVHHRGVLYFVGMVGSGLSNADLDAFSRLAGSLARDASPFANPVLPGVRFLDPVLVAEVTFSEVTTGGTLRHPVLIGFRTDINAADVVVDAELADFIDPSGTTL